MWKPGILAAVGGLVLGIVLGPVLPAVADGEYGEEEGLEEVLAVFEVLTADLVPASKALATALAAHPGDGLEVELDVARGKDGVRVVWDVGIVTEKGFAEAYVDARTGELLGSEAEEEPEEAAEVRAFLSEGRVGLARALARLESSVEGRVVAVEIDEEDDRPVWEANLVQRGRMAEVLVAADTGKIVLDDEDDDEDEEEEDDD